MSNFLKTNNNDLTTVYQHPKFHDDLDFTEYITFYIETDKNPQHEQDIRRIFNNKTNKKAHRKVLKTVERITIFNKVRQDITEGLKKKIQELPDCRVMPIIRAIDTSLDMIIEKTNGTKECAISGHVIPYARKITIHPSPEDAPPTFTKPVVFYVRSDFERVLVCYRTISRFRYTCMKLVNDWNKDHPNGNIMSDTDQLQYIYDVWLDARMRITQLTYGNDCSFFV